MANMATISLMRSLLRWWALFRIAQLSLSDRHLNREAREINTETATLAPCHMNLGKGLAILFGWWSKISLRWGINV